MIVQIYEIQTPYEAEKCIELGVDHIGSVLLSQDDWKDNSIKEVSILLKESQRKHSIIPLFNEIDTIERVIDYYMPDIIHFCEDMAGERDLIKSYLVLQERLKKKYPELLLMRTIPFPEPGVNPSYSPLDVAGEFETVSDYFLADTKQTQDIVQGYIGISGKVCNWDMVRDLVKATQVPVIIAGGLSPENVYEALKRTGARGADSCSMTNMRDEKGRIIRFKKDFERVKRFVMEVKRAEKSINR